MERHVMVTSFAWGRAARLVICGLTVCYLVGPLLIVLVLSFSSAQFLTFPPPSFSLQLYRNLLQDPRWAATFITSVEIMIPTAILATLCATAAACGAVRLGARTASFVSAFVLAPIVTPVIITAAAIYGLFQRLDLNGTLAGLVLAHTVITLPYVFITVFAALRTIDPRLEAVARTLGAPPPTAFRRIVLPLIMPAILAGSVFSMVVSFDELVVSLFISTPEVQPLTVHMWSDVMGDVDPTITALSSFLLCIAFLAICAQRASLLALRRSNTGPDLGRPT
jgi:putative spermidine/putrescine transport system permease protein